jgi:hypothetical protein
MANNSTQTAFLFRCGTKANARMIAKLLNADDVFYPDALVEKMTNEGMEWDEVNGAKVPSYTICSAESDDDTLYVCVDDADLTQTAVVLDYAMQNMPEVPSPQGFAWANWCSKMRAGEFDGGGVVLARGRPWKWTNTTQWVEDECKKIAHEEEVNQHREDYKKSREIPVEENRA